MKFGYILPNYGDKITPQELLEISAVCEECGYDSVWATDHVILPTELREPYGQLIEPMTMLAFIASRREKLRVGTSILVLPQRNPILVAKQAAALDVLSEGRLILGVGVGWAEKEFGFLGADFGRRGKVMDESIVLMRKLWNDDVVDFEGRFFRVREALFFPKPLNRAVPVWIGGNGSPSLRRAAAYGDGWHPVGPDLEDFAKGAAKIRESKKDIVLSVRMTTDVRKKREAYAGANNEKRVAVSGTATEIRQQIDGYADAGLEYYCASMNHPAASDIVSDLRKFAEDVIRSYG
ncbi:MAG: LLM class F420-dependent oxidoreductase [Nitrososphaerota archaeon]|nr:LLM class F420-dependent oxidoreductase [Nitrososphaerota archaeon]